MKTYGYIRTSREPAPGDPTNSHDFQHGLLTWAGVDPGRIYTEWQILDQQLAHGDVLVTAAIDRLARGISETMRIIYDLHRRGIRLRSLADNEGEWTKFLDADPDSPEASMGNILASMAAYVASQERQAISRSTRVGLEVAKAKGKRVGRPRRLTGEQLTAIRRDVKGGMPVAAVARKHRVPRSTVRGALKRSDIPKTGPLAGELLTSGAGATASAGLEDQHMGEDGEAD